MYQERGDSSPVTPASTLECASYSVVSGDPTDLIQSGRQERSSKLSGGLFSPKEVTESSCNLIPMYDYSVLHRFFQGYKVYGEGHDK